ncbi:hypothetical protein N0V85_008335 [Neurospora sp. IMI 360204]|nr:hypothetical protein N0V85_008335 [Neurospora sp. IMI 360204]
MSSIGLNVIAMIESCTENHCYTGSERMAMARDIILASNLDTDDKLLEMMFALHGTSPKNNEVDEVNAPAPTEK